jgi:translation elongation factor EF-Tu-like GTPase
MAIPQVVTAVIRSLSPDEGGIAKPFYSGYRAHMVYDNAPSEPMHAVVIAPESGVINHGQTARCKIYLSYPEYHERWLAVGAKFKVSEAGRMRAVGVIESADDDPDGSEAKQFEDAARSNWTKSVW